MRSPNCGPRRDDARPDIVVLHFTAMKTAAAARERLCDPAAEVSAHYLISETGDVCALVPEALRAWHAGAGAWGGVTDVNSRSIGIELANRGDHPFPHPQMRALETLLTGILDRWDVPPDRVIGHSDMAIGRKVDPGPRFDWRLLARLGLSIWPEQAAPGDFRADARAFGYRGTDDAGVLAAFRLRFRPCAAGPLDVTDRRIMAALARDWPCRDAAGTAPGIMPAGDAAAPRTG